MVAIMYPISTLYVNASAAVSETNGHSQNGDANVQNGVNTTVANNAQVHLDKTNQDIVRLICQYLKVVGLERSSELLMQESGCNLEHPYATKFRQHVMAGDWTKADHYLQELQPMVEGKQSSIEMKFLLLEQKYLEYLEDSRPLDALHVLRNELTPLQHNTPRVHQLSSYMMCANSDDLYRRAHWEGKGNVSRTRLMDRLQTYLPATVMLPPRRLRTLLKQAVELQAEKCPCHDMAWETHIDNVCLLTDHNCSQDGFPLQSLQILTEHCDEVWYCKFSPDGLKLATGSKDTTVHIYDVDPQKLTVKPRRALEGHTYGVSFVAWSPDSKHLLVCGTEESPDLFIWNIDEEKVVVKMSNSPDDSLACAAFNKDGSRFVAGGQKGQFYVCDLSGTIHDSWDGVRVNALAYRSDNKSVLAADTLYRIREYSFETRTEQNLVQEEHPIQSFTVNSADRLALINVKTQGVHMWDLQDKCLVRKFQGVTQSLLTIHSCFGGVNESFIASGSEDCKVYIWQIRREEPLAKLVGHTKPVNCVSWNPVYPAILASASDDATVRIWGPRSLQSNQSESDECSSCSSSSSWNMTT
ncbi:hypothetical protein HA402_004196 [Bradysia odoriphaga]|nr:hypothetical protein HA402_004196 [Bradysia odoriphaga]